MWILYIGKNLNNPKVEDMSFNKSELVLDFKDCSELRRFLGICFNFNVPKDIDISDSSQYWKTTKFLYEKPYGNDTFEEIRYNFYAQNQNVKS